MKMKKKKNTHTTSSKCPTVKKQTCYSCKTSNVEHWYDARCDKYRRKIRACVQIFHKPLLECELLTEKEVAMIFVNWKELIMCNIKLLK